MAVWHARRRLDQTAGNKLEPFKAHVMALKSQISESSLRKGSKLRQTGMKSSQW